MVSPTKHDDQRENESDVRTSHQLEPLIEQKASGDLQIISSPQIEVDVS